jgi:hypothetical protein
MRSFLLTGAALLLGAAIVAPAMAEGPRPSSENHWPGMQDWPGVQSVPQHPAASRPHYVWEEGYDRGGKWHAHWQLVR